MYEIWLNDLKSEAALIVYLIQAKRGLSISIKLVIRWLLLDILCSGVIMKCFLISY